jgi:hypothetical protein
MQLSTQGKEKRAAKRVPHKAVVIMACGEGEQLEFEKAELVDCSPPGVAILFHRPLRVGDHFLLKLKLDRPFLARYDVKHCQPQENASFRIGGQFVDFVGPAPEPDGDALFKALLAT